MKKLFFALCILCTACSTAPIETSSDELTAETKLLMSRNAQFEREIVKIADNVYTAVGYDASNVTMIIGDDGIILIDGGKTASLTKEIAEDFRKITTKPITGVVITHGHGDHTQGLMSFLTENDKPKIYAAENFGIESEFSKAVGFKNPRSYRQSGIRVPPHLRINNGVAPVVYPGGREFDEKPNPAHANLYVPLSRKNITNFVSADKETITISGITLELVRADGETADHLLIYYKDKGILFPGDMFYRSFPNLYAIRGTEYRDVNKWVEALNTLLSFEAEALLQGHTRPVIGKENVKNSITNMRDAVQFVLGKTVDGMNKGMTPDELVEYVVLPDHLANDPDLGQYYGRVDWAVRNIFSGYNGWFDGNPTSLRPLSPKAEAEKFVALVGGKAKVEKAAQEALKSGEYQWAAELSDRLLALEPENKVYKLIKADALFALANHIETATGRNYYNSVALELSK